MKSSERFGVRAVVAAIFATALVFSTSLSAQAATANVAGDQPSNQLIYYSTFRYHAAGAAFFRLDYSPVCLGGDVRLGLYKTLSQGQVTDTLIGYTGQSRNFRNINGSTSIGAGSYAFDVKLVGGCAGSNPWGGLFSY